LPPLYEISFGPPFGGKRLTRRMRVLCPNPMERVATLAPPPSVDSLAADGPLALFLDFDGTLVDIAATPDEITVPRDLADRLDALAHRFDGRVALISGRAIGSLHMHCGMLRIACAGSHGAELRSADGADIAVAPPLLSEEVAAEVARYARAKNIDYEIKPHGAALHSRKRPELEGECAEFVADLARRYGLAVKHGRRVAELVGTGCDKGTAVRALMSEPPFAGATAIFVGDDETDEDGFAACAEFGGFGIAVGERPSGAARYRLADPSEVREWLNL
jgi:trehalose 6-phosphate phosphatase